MCRGRTVCRHLDNVSVNKNDPRTWTEARAGKHRRARIFREDVQSNASNTVKPEDEPLVEPVDELEPWVDWIKRVIYHMEGD